MACTNEVAMARIGKVAELVHATSPSLYMRGKLARIEVWSSHSLEPTSMARQPKVDKVLAS
jgi:hypothetical protein